MGVNKLWSVLNRIGQERSLVKLSLDEGLDKNDHGTGLLKVGIDASVWMGQSEAVFFHPGHAAAGQNPELRTLFFKLAQLLNTCILPIFVFDGPLRPAMKRGQNVIPIPHWLTNDFKELIDAFGFYSHEAPGEAEAELAQLNAMGAIDAIITDDSDAFVFGATQVIRTSAQTGKSDDVTLYSLSSIESDPGVGMIQEDMVLIALLVGGDYDQTGLQGCGIKTAHNIVRNSPLGLGYRLIHAFETKEEVEFSAYLAGWRNELRQIFSTADWLLGHRYPKLAASIGDDYPPVSVLKKYVRPVTSWSIGDDTEAPDASLWEARTPDLGKITRICERLFTWGTGAGIVGKLSQHVWPGTCLRALLQRGGHIGTISAGGEGLPIVTRINRARKGQGRAAGVTMYHLEASTVPLQDVVNASLRGLRHPQQQQQPPARVTLRVPASVVDQALPDLVQQFIRKSASKS